MEKYILLAFSANWYETVCRICFRCFF